MIGLYMYIKLYIACKIWASAALRLGVFGLAEVNR